MNVRTLLKLAEKAIHPSVDPNEAALASTMAQKACNDAGMTISDFVEAKYSDTLPARTATASQLRKKVAELESARADLEVERDIALTRVREALDVARSVAELEAEKDILAADVIAQAALLAEAARFHADLKAESAAKDARIAELEAQATKTIFKEASEPVQVTIDLVQEAVESVGSVDGVQEPNPVQEAAEPIALAKRFVLMARNWCSLGASLGTIAVRLSKQIGLKVSTAMVRKVTRWKPGADGYCWAPAG